ncbi:MAG TPA: hypothetical protein VE912_24875 [Bacteroidales bacterium]|nr:hypothetical protein [Bacteroidales bacterium]
MVQITRLLVSFILLIAPVGITFGQTPVYQNYTDFIRQLQEDHFPQGKVTIHQDERINLLVYKHIEQRKKEQGVPGYRIRIFSNSGQSARQNALQEKSRFMKDFPDINSYLIYDSPNFKIYVGDFRTKSQAIKAYKRIVQEFPYAFIINDQIRTDVR